MSRRASYGESRVLCHLLFNENAKALTNPFYQSKKIGVNADIADPCIFCTFVQEIDLSLVRKAYQMFYGKNVRQNTSVGLFF